MWKNREIKWLLLLAAVLCAVIVSVSFVRPSMTAVTAVAAIVILTAAYVGATVYRFRKIRMLSDYLYKLADGGRALLPDKYTEGELSLLQSEIYKLAVRLSEQAELLMKDKNYLADAISDISHQLKTPVTSMRVMADLLSDGGLSDERRAAFTANIQSQLNRMEWLVTALLKMAKLDAGAVTMKNELLIPMELKHITFELEGDMKAEISGDIGWLSEAVANILKNCIEHTPVGGRIVVHAEKTALYTSITISDTGCGIAEDDLSHIFERFYKGKNSSSDSVGIGLAMAKQIMTETNGTLAVTKTGERGTTFMLKLYRK